MVWQERILNIDATLSFCTRVGHGLVKTGHFFDFPFSEFRPEIYSTFSSID